MADGDIYQGDIVVIQTDFTDTALGTSEAPATLNVKVQGEDGTSLYSWTYPVSQITKPDPTNFPGRFLIEVDCSPQAGDYTVQARCPSGLGQSVQELTLYVKPRVIA